MLPPPRRCGGWRCRRVWTDRSREDQPGTATLDLTLDHVDVVFEPGGLGVRMDSALYSGYRIPPYYDSLAAKLIVRAHDRAAAVDGALAAVRNTRVAGLTTTLPMLEAVLAHEDFRAGPVPTTWFGREWESMREEIG